MLILCVHVIGKKQSKRNDLSKKKRSFTNNNNIQNKNPNFPLDIDISKKNSNKN